MFKLIDGLDPDILGVEVTGKIKHEDYQDFLIPHAEEMMKKGPIRLLYLIGKDFSGYELAALWDDNAFGVKHWRDFTHVAIVTDNIWMKGFSNIFTPFFPGEVKIFSLDDLEGAKAWISHSQKVVLKRRKN